MRIVFMGTPAFAVPTLRALVEQAQTHSWRVVGVLTQPDRPAGRGNKVVASPVKEYALSKGISVLQPVSLRKDAAAVDSSSAAPAPDAGSTPPSLAPDVHIPKDLGALAGAVEKHGKVRLAEGVDGVAKGDRCTLFVRPNPAFPASSPHNCKILVSCGEHVVYDGGENGDAHCKTAAGELKGASDSRRSAADGDPDLALILDTGHLRIRDDGEVDVLISLAH